MKKSMIMTAALVMLSMPVARAETFERAAVLEAVKIYCADDSNRQNADGKQLTISQCEQRESANTCEYSGQDHQYHGSCYTRQTKAAFKAFCQDADGARGAYDEREACTKLLHPIRRH